MAADMFPVTVNQAAADIGITLSSLLANEAPVGRGRGSVRLFNSAGNARLYIALQDTAPDSDMPGVGVRPGEWFPMDIQITPAGGVWAWAGKDGAKITALVVGWS